jgi:hypothetical protein
VPFPGAPCMPCPPFMFGQLCVLLCEGVGAVVAVFAGAGSTAVLDDVDDDVVEAEVPGCAADRKAAAEPTPSAPVPTRWR